MPEKAERFDPESVCRQWNDAADAYAEMQAEGHDFYRYEFFGPAMLDLCGEVAGLKALDLGCGTGYFARRLAERGARVVGVDISVKQIEHARWRETEVPQGIEYAVQDAAEVGDRWPKGSFDLVTSCVSLQDMPDARAALRGSFSVLRPGGRLVAMITHPCTDTPYRVWEKDDEGRKLSLKIDRYFERVALEYEWASPRFRYPFRTTGFHAPLCDWMDLFLDAGFRLLRLSEPRPTEEALRRRPDLEDAAKVPYFIGLDFLKSEGDG